MKITKSPSTALYPVPVVLVTSSLEGFKPNIITVAWTGTMNSEPPMVFVSVRPGRHSHKMIKESGQYVINIPSAQQVKLVDQCGISTGRDTDKFQATGLTPVPAAHVQAPLIKECPVNLECEVKQVISLGTHDAFIGEILAVHINEDVVSNGRIDFDLAKPFAYCGNQYRINTEVIGTHGFSAKEGK